MLVFFMKNKSRKIGAWPPAKRLWLPADGEKLQTGGQHQVFR